jgi:NUMOD1 domain
MKDFYVYIYFNPLNKGNFVYGSYTFDFEPLYIGKGKGRRAHTHLTSCLNKNDKKGYRRLFYQKLRKLLKSGNPPIILIYKNNLTENEAHTLEIDLVASIGRRIHKEGPLCNNSMGGEGAVGATAPRFSVCVYDNDGNIISVESSVKECSKKYKVSEMTIYKHLRGTRKIPANGFRFKKESDNIKKLCRKEEIVINKKGKHSNIYPLSKKVYQYTKEGVFIKEYPNANIASLELGILRSAIQNNLTNRSKTCNNYIFKH